MKKKKKKIKNRRKKKRMKKKKTKKMMKDSKGIRDRIEYNAYLKTRGKRARLKIEIL